MYKHLKRPPSPECLDDYATTHLDTVTLRLAPSDIVRIHPTNVYILCLTTPVLLSSTP
jgi:hypothetical protein